jgi:hypothetical protein
MDAMRQSETMPGDVHRRLALCSSAIQSVTGGTVLSPGPVASFITDTRASVRDKWFIALQVPPQRCSVDLKPSVNSLCLGMLMASSVQGKSHDGHDFLGQALTHGAAGLVIQKAFFAELSDGEQMRLVAAVRSECAGLVVVPNTQNALEGLAKHALRNFHGDIIAVSGSVGKTSCKSLVCHSICIALFWMGAALLQSIHSHAYCRLQLLSAPSVPV